jgi:uncharacterized phage protein gp47/JayE
MTQSATAALYQTQTKTQAQIRDDILRTLSNHLISIGIPSPNVGPGSDYYGLATGVANEICVGLANGVISINNQMPDTAAGTYLDRWLALFGLARNGATQSSGNISPVFSIAQGYVLIPTGAVLIDSVGLRYMVTAGGSYGPGNAGMSQPPNLQVPVISIDTGSATDHANGDLLSWVTILPFIGPQASVGAPNGTDGLTGGNDSEQGQDEPPRARLRALLQFPPGGGNWSDVNQWAVQSSPDVQGCACYPALLGPASVFFCAWRAAQVSAPFTDTSKNRDLPVTLMTGTVIPFVQGRYSARAVVVGATPINQPSDVALILALPSAPSAQPSGPGGGWLDGTPWPSSLGGTAPTTITAVVTSVQFVCNAITAPTPGVTHVAYLSPSNWQIYTALVLAVSGSSGSYTVTIDTAWPNLATDLADTGPPILFPQAINQANYVAAALQGFANLGPGEWTNNPTARVRAFRHPQPLLAWPYSLDANFLRILENSGSEVATAQFIYRQAVAPNVPSGTPSIGVTDPFTLLSSPPGILVPQNIGFYAA